MRRLELPTLLLLAACGGGPPLTPLPALDAPAPNRTATPAPVDLVPATAAFDPRPALTAQRYPVPDWDVGTPEDQGLDSAALAYAGQIAESEDSECLLVIRHGVLVFERYFQGATAQSTHPSWSIAKSWTSTLFGIALARGDLKSLDQKVADFVPEWRTGPRAQVTLRQLLSMSSGLHWSLAEDYVGLAVLSQDNTRDAVARQLDASPGTKWVYNNGAVQVLERVLKAATGQNLEQYARTHLWSRLGMQATWKTDPAGNPTAYANVLATCRDHARLGYLYLRHGQWAGVAGDDGAVRARRPLRRARFRQPVHRRHPQPRPGGGALRQRPDQRWAGPRCADDRLTVRAPREDPRAGAAGSDALTRRHAPPQQPVLFSIRDSLHPAGVHPAGRCRKVHWGMNMKVPPWLTKSWPFAVLAVLFLFFAIQLSRARGCASPSDAPKEQHWPTQRRPPPGR